MCADYTKISVNFIVFGSTIWIFVFIKEMLSVMEFNFMFCLFILYKIKIDFFLVLELFGFAKDVATTMIFGFGIDEEYNNNNDNRKKNRENPFKLVQQNLYPPIWT
jgi:hypothetical protein